MKKIRLLKNLANILPKKQNQTVQQHSFVFRGRTNNTTIFNATNFNIFKRSLPKLVKITENVNNKNENQSNVPKKNETSITQWKKRKSKFF